MNPNENDLLKKTYEVAQENNHILKGIRSSNRWSMFFRIAKWVVIIGVSVGAFYFIQPYVDPFLKAYQDIQSSFGKVKSVVNSFPKSN